MRGWAADTTQHIQRNNRRAYNATQFGCPPMVIIGTRNKQKTTPNREAGVTYIQKQTPQPTRS